jgi:thioredoxin-like negative regulator of GroEL
MAVYKVKAEQFDKKILNSSMPCVVKFSSEGCHLCVELKPLYRAISQAYEGMYKFYTLSIDEAPDLSNKYITNGVPTLYIFFNGNAHLIPDPENPDSETWYDTSYIIEHLDKFSNGGKL